ncbi:RIP metalloprotease RseP [Agathobaculum butyriciproducens]|uniref:RIP metalloprotease RseP n=1 Tax=Agathobaculum butyriciproducens TaxID=1628085 RepID=UPI001D082930|nr:RIP metalloprotease RseP [Agathobaculum butyriciproducens]MCQ5046408.1 RIP metalloprotease RseP [Agathobaculum butyriciproducens]
MLQIILAILAFGVLVIVHEFGHFITAKRGGVQVNEFWIGMGPTILKHEHKGTLYCLKLLPFGGACVMEGEDGESENEHAFGKAKLPRRMLIVCAGALMNFLVGFLIVLAVMQPNGPNGGYIVSTVDSIDPASTAAGDLKAGDEILKIDGYHILVRSDFETALSRTASTTYKVTVRREGEKVTLPSVKLEATVTDANGNKRIGITFAELPDSLGMHLSMSVRTAVNYARLVWSSMGMLVSGQVGVDQLAGPVGMAEVMADTAKYSMISFFQLVAFISINLGVMNLLPLPALDGGRLVFLIIEGIRRKPVPPRYEGYVHAAGLMLLLMLMVYVTGQDVLRIFMRSN